MDFIKSFPEINRSELPQHHDASPFLEGDTFDAVAELVNLKKHHGQEGLDKLRDYKEKLNFKKIGLAAMEVKLFDLIEKNPNAQASDLENLIASDIKKYALIPEERDKFYTILSA